MRKKTIAILLFAFLLQIAVAVSVSAEVTVEPETSSVTISGTIDAEDKVTNIGIDVFCPGYDYDALRNVPMAEFKRAIVLRNQTVSNDKGEWSLTFRINDDESIDYDAPSGRYTAVIFPQNAEKSYTEEFAYLNLKAAEKAVNKMKSGGNIADIVKEAPADLGLTDYYGDSISADNLAKLIKDAMDGGKLDNVSITEAIGVIQNAAAIEAISEGKIKDLFEYGEALKLSESRLAPYLEKSYMTANRRNITSALNGKYFDTYAEFYKKLEDAAVLAVVKNPDGISNIREITEGIVGSKHYSDNTYRNVMGKSYGSISDYTNALDKSENTVSSSGGSGGGGGGGSSGKGSSGHSSVSGMSFVETKQPPAQTMTYHIFTDIDDVEWAKDAIVYLAQLDIVSGKSDELFYPNDNITREELVKILVLALGEDTEADEISFNDVDKSAWYYPYVAKAVKMGMVSGYSDDVFGTGDLVTRQDMTTMIYRAAKAKGINVETASTGFADEAQISEYAKEAVGALSAKGIVNGIDNYTFAPLESATRAQVAKIVYRVLLI